MRHLLLLLAILTLAGCGGGFSLGLGGGGAGKADPTYGYYKIGKPYKISGRWYRPQVDYDYKETGIASWYGKQFHGKPTANGAVFDMNEVSAAHRTLPLPSYVLVENLENGRKLKILVNDRGPFYNNRIIDLSREAADRLGMLKKGTAKVRVSILAHESSLLAGRIQQGRRSGGKVSAGLVPQASPTGKITQRDLPPTRTKRGWTNTAAAAKPDATTQQASFGGGAGGKIYIQVGAYSQYANAVGAQQRLRRFNKVELWQTGGEPPLYRVRLGPFGRMGEANGLLDHVKDAGFGDAQVVVEKTASN